MTLLFAGLCEQWALSRRGNDETSGDGHQAGIISPWQHCLAVVTSIQFPHGVNNDVSMSENLAPGLKQI